MSTDHYDVAIVGGGIVGLAHAWSAAKRGKSVIVFERTPTAQGASIRNFGMVWPIGQPAGERYQIAMNSRRSWLELRDEAKIWVNECGSVHAAHELDERAVIEEFALRAAKAGTTCEYQTASDASKRFPSLEPNNLKGVLYSPTELCVDPRQVLQRLPIYLREKHQVLMQSSTTIIEINGRSLTAASGQSWRAERILVCSGTDFETLFPSEFAAAGIRKCKLQMMRTYPQPNDWRLGPHVAGGLTLCHYQSFQECPTLATLRQRYAHEYPNYIKHGIHVMVSQNAHGELIIGDSHEYDQDITIFDSTVIDDLILTYLKKLIRYPDLRIASRWHGIYAKHPQQPLVCLDPQPNCTIVVAPGGHGMTMSFGYAEAWWDAYTANRTFHIA